MIIVDGITKYLEAKEAGMPEAQAQLFARSWAETYNIHPQAATKEDLRVLHPLAATKEDLKILHPLAATKEDLKVLHPLAATKEDLKIIHPNAATKEDIARLDKDIIRLERYVMHEMSTLKWLIGGVGAISALPVLHALLTLIPWPLILLK